MRHPERAVDLIRKRAVFRAIWPTCKCQGGMAVRSFRSQTKSDCERERFGEVRRGPF